MERERPILERTVVDLAGRHLVPMLLGILVITSVFTSCASQITRSELAGEYLNLGNAYFELGDYEQAAEYYARAADLDPQLRAAGLNLARAYISEARYAEALSIIDELLADDPENARVLQTRAYALYQAGRADEALAVYRSVLAEDPFNSDVLYNVSVILQAQGEAEEALSRVRVALEVAEDDAEALRLAGRLAYQLTRYDDAIMYIESYLAGESEDNAAKALLGDALRKGGFVSRALSTYDEVLKEEPRNPDALFGKSVALLTAAEDEEGGLEALRSAVSAGFANSSLAEAELLVDANVALEASRQILVDRGVIEASDSQAGVDNETVPSDGEAGEE